MQMFMPRSHFAPPARLTSLPFDPVPGHPAAVVRVDVYVSAREFGGLVP